MDQKDNRSALYISSRSTHISESSKLMFGLPNVGGYGEWSQNTRASASAYGISIFTNSIERIRVGTDYISLLNVTAGNGSDLVINSSGQVFSQPSSARYKEDITEFKDDFEKVLALEPVTFRYRDSGQNGVGYLAEDLHEKGLGSLVSYDDEGKPHSINYKLLPVYLLELLKSQQAVIEQLQARVAALTFA